LGAFFRDGWGSVITYRGSFAMLRMTRETFHERKRPKGRTGESKPDGLVSPDGEGAQGKPCFKSL
jgi:hypothetical protein